MDGNLVIFALTSLVLGAGAGFFLGRYTSGVVLFVLWAALAGSLLVLLIAPLGRVLGLAQDEWSRMVYIYTSVIFLGPALVSTALFGWLGLRRRRRALTERRDDV
jgi:hypothetical protein